MNIFVLDQDPKIAASYHNDKHCIKMILEGCQMLSTAHRVLDGVKTVGVSASGRKKTEYVLAPYDKHYYKATHINHPCSVWVRECSANYYWLSRLTQALCTEYSIRYRKEHACLHMINAQYSLARPPKNINDSRGIENITPFAQAMPDKYKNNDAVQAYRAYYMGEKRDLADWRVRGVPAWWQ